MGDEKIKMDNTYAYFLGFITLAFALFLGYHWSPDYMEYCSNGNNFLFIAGTGLVAIICFKIIDIYYKNKTKENLK